MSSSNRLLSSLSTSDIQLMNVQRLFIRNSFDWRTGQWDPRNREAE